MNFMKNSKCFMIQKSKWLPGRTQKTLQSFPNKKCLKIVHTKRLIHHKSLPPLVSSSQTKDLESAKPINSDENLPMKPERVQRDIFGATILPQNLSFENTKKLSENQVRLEDIPLVDENEIAEEMVAEKLKTGKVSSPKEDKDKTQRDEDDVGMIIVQGDFMKQPRQLKKSVAELFWVADPYEEIPGPKIFRNFVNSLKQFSRQLTIISLFRFIKANALAPFRVYGPIVKVPEILGGKIVLISRPDHISAVFEQDQRHPINSTLDSIQRSRLQNHRKNQRINYHLTEEEWENVRKSLGEPSRKGSEKYFDGIDDAASKLVRRIRTVRNKQNEAPDDFLFEINKWSLECLCFVIFDKPFGFLDYESVSWPSKTSQLLYALTVATKKLCHLETGFQFWRFMNTSSLSSLGYACDILEGIISQYVGQMQLSLIKRSEDVNEGKGEVGSLTLIEGCLLQENTSPDEIVTSILDTLLIGMNTMSTALGFLLYHLSQNPRVQAELWKEIKKVLPEKYSRLEQDQLNSLKYLQACLKESLRLKMPMPVLTRVLSKNVTLSNYQIPKGTFVLMTAQVEGMKEENFDDPTKFIPERWLDHDTSHPFVSLPLGNYFQESFERRIAEISIWVCVSQILRHFTVEYFYGDIEATSTAISFPNKPLKFTFNDRKE